MHRNNKDVNTSGQNGCQRDDKTSTRDKPNSRIADDDQSKRKYGAHSAEKYYMLGEFTHPKCPDSVSLAIS